MPLKQSIQIPLANDPRSVQRFALDVAKAMDTRRVAVRFTIGEESAGVRSVTAQVIDRHNREPISGRWLLRFWFATTEWGSPDGEQNTVVTTGTLVSNTDEQIIEAATDDGGELVFTVEIATAGDRYIYLANLEELESTGSVESAGGGTYTPPPSGGGGGAPETAQYVTLATNATLTQERVLTAGTGISITDGGAGGSVTVAASGPGLVRSGSASVDFGGPTEDGFASVTVTGQAWVTADAIIHAKVAGVATADHGADDAAIECLTATVGNIVAGTGFDINVGAPGGTWGTYTVQWMGVDP